MKMCLYPIIKFFGNPYGDISEKNFDVLFLILAKNVCVHLVSFHVCFISIYNFASYALLLRSFVLISFLY